MFTGAEALAFLLKRWKEILLIALIGVIVFQRSEIRTLLKESGAKDAQISNLKASVGNQNAAVTRLEKQTADQVQRLNDALNIVNEMKPRTITTIQRIYSERETDARTLLLKALTD